MATTHMLRCCGCGRRRTWWLLEPAVIRAGPFMYSGIVRRGGNTTHVTLGFVFESFRDQVAACDPWCGQLQAPGSAGLGATVGESVVSQQPLATFATIILDELRFQTDGMAAVMQARGWGSRGRT